jgi:predicted ester cyclase
MRGTHDGAFMGVPPSGRQIRVSAMNFYRIADGKIVEEFGQPDMFGLMLQIGAIPLP